MKISKKLIADLKQWKYVSMFGHDKLEVIVNILDPSYTQVSLGEDYLPIDVVISNLKELAAKLEELEQSLK